MSCYSFDTNKKTVFILGAGFSKTAGAPSQGEIMNAIFALPNHIDGVLDARDCFRDFLLNELNLAEGKLGKATLEDIYTPIDRCIADGISLRSKGPDKLKEIRDQIDFLISTAIETKIGASPLENRGYIRVFAELLVSIAERRAEYAKEDSAKKAKAYDPFSVICLNWDILLDNSIARALEAAYKPGQRVGDYEAFGVVDYCCYVSSLVEDDSRIRTGLWSLGARGYNVKLLKIHGSLNWLQCSHCQRLFTTFDEKVSIQNFISRRTCRHCDKYGEKPLLHGTLLMPTFLKDLSNFQLKLVWQNAGVEIMEADRLVFIGYSLPFADFEFRQLISRMVKKSAEIVSVLYKDPGFTEAKERYETFFSGHSVEIIDEGASDYVRKVDGEYFCHNTKPSWRT
jgi:hypothetical protein